MKNDTLQSVKHFDMHNDPLTNIDSLHLVVWNAGLSIAGYNAEGEVLTTKIYPLNRIDIPQIESIFINEPLVAGPQPVTKVWVADERHMIVPGPLFEAKAASEWLETFFFLEAGSSVESTSLPQSLNAHFIYPLSEQLLSLLRKYFGENKVYPLSKALLSQEVSAEGNYIDITLLGPSLILSCYQNGNLLNHQVTDTIASTDLVYKIASVAADYKLPLDSLKIALSGFAVTEELSQELKTFFPKIVIPGSEQFSSFTLLRKLIICA